MLQGDLGQHVPVGHSMGMRHEYNWIGCLEQRDGTGDTFSSRMRCSAIHRTSQTETDHHPPSNYDSVTAGSARKSTL
jgi:hypothetical protein